MELLLFMQETHSETFVCQYLLSGTKVQLCFSLLWNRVNKMFDCGKQNV